VFRRFTAHTSSWWISLDCLTPAVTHCKYSASNTASAGRPFVSCTAVRTSQGARTRTRVVSMPHDVTHCSSSYTFTSVSSGKLRWKKALQSRRRVTKTYGRGGRLRGLPSNPMTRQRSKVHHNVKERNNRRGMREKK